MHCLARLLSWPDQHVTAHYFPPLVACRFRCFNNRRQIVSLDQQINVSGHESATGLSARHQVSVDRHATDHLERYIGLVQYLDNLLQFIEEVVHSRLKQEIDVTLLAGVFQKLVECLHYSPFVKIMRMGTSDTSSIGGLRPPESMGGTRVTRPILR